MAEIINCKKFLASKKFKGLCEKRKVPYELALLVADCESDVNLAYPRTNSDVGTFQLNSSYHPYSNFKVRGKIWYNDVVYNEQLYTQYVEYSLQVIKDCLAAAKTNVYSPYTEYARCYIFYNMGLSGGRRLMYYNFHHTQFKESLRRRYARINSKFKANGVDFYIYENLANSDFHFLRPIT